VSRDPYEVRCQRAFFIASGSDYLIMSSSSRIRMLKEEKSTISLPKLPMIGEDFKLNAAIQSVPCTPSRYGKKKPPLLTRRKAWRQLPHLHVTVPKDTNKMDFITFNSFAVPPPKTLNTHQPQHRAPSINLEFSNQDKKVADPYQVLPTPSPSHCGMDIE